MRKLSQLLERWASEPAHQKPVRTYQVSLPVHDAARLEALMEMYPQVGREALLREILSAALDEIEASFPYVPGEREIARDEFDDPIYEDTGPSRRFHELTRKHAAHLSTAPDHE